MWAYRRHDINRDCFGMDGNGEIDAWYLIIIQITVVPPTRMSGCILKKVLIKPDLKSTSSIEVLA